MGIDRAFFGVVANSLDGLRDPAQILLIEESVAVGERYIINTAVLLQLDLQIFLQILDKFFNKECDLRHGNVISITLVASTLDFNLEFSILFSLIEHFYDIIVVVSVHDKVLHLVSSGFKPMNFLFADRSVIFEREWLATVWHG